MIILLSHCLGCCVGGGHLLNKRWRGYDCSQCHLYMFYLHQMILSSVIVAAGKRSSKSYCWNIQGNRCVKCHLIVLSWSTVPFSWLPHPWVAHPRGILKVGVCDVASMVQLGPVDPEDKLPHQAYAWGVHFLRVGDPQTKMDPHTIVCHNTPSPSLIGYPLLGTAFMIKQNIHRREDVVGEILTLLINTPSALFTIHPLLPSPTQWLCGVSPNCPQIGGFRARDVFFILIIAKHRAPLYLSLSSICKKS